jgi:hypothetical protein
LPFGHPDDFKWFALKGNYKSNDIKFHYLEMPFDLRLKQSIHLEFMLE